MRQQLKNCPLLLGSSARRARLGQHWQTRDAATVPSPHPPASPRARAALALAARLRRIERTPQPQVAARARRRVPVAACRESRRHAKKKKNITGRIASYRAEHTSHGPVRRRGGVSFTRPHVMSSARSKRNLRTRSWVGSWNVNGLYVGVYGDKMAFCCVATPRGWRCT